MNYEILTRGGGRSPQYVSALDLSSLIGSLLNSPPPGNGATNTTSDALQASAGAHTEQPMGGGDRPAPPPQRRVPAPSTAAPVALANPPPMPPVRPSDLDAAPAPTAPASALSNPPPIPTQAPTSPAPTNPPASAAPAWQNDPIVSRAPSGPQLVPVDHDPWAQFVPPSSPQAGNRNSGQASAGGAAATPSTWQQDPIVGNSAPASTDPVEAYNQLPWYGKAMQAADDTARLVANGMSLGWADKGSAWLNSKLGAGDYATNLAQERQADADASARAGLAGTLDGIAGMVAPGSAVGKLAGALGAASKAVPIAGRVLGSGVVQNAATGAALGAGNAAGNDENVGAGAAVGAGAGVAGHAVGAAIGKGADELAGLFNKAPSHLDAAGLKAASQALYNDPVMESTLIHPDAVQRLSDAVKSTMFGQAYDPATHPGGAAILGVLDRMQGGGGLNTLNTLKGLETLRQTAGNVAGMGGPNAALGSAVKRTFDRFADNLQPADIVDGDAGSGIAKLQEARDLWQRQAKLKAVEDAQEKAGDRAAATYSGGNINNATRQNSVRLKWGRNDWTPDEASAIQNVINPGATSNVLRAIGKFSPEHGGLASMIEMGASGLGAHEGGLAGLAAGAVPAAAGFVSKRLADALTAQRMSSLQTLIANGGNASATFGAPNAVQRLARSKADLLGQALTNAGIMMGSEGRR